ncbi:hypothetical protein GCM10009123_12750 [Kangiella japonica]|uniref:Transposase n=1 Tax=Kangiella japonica TaxID=647384 RepID=A0ABN0SYN9_9GAMM
MLGIAICYRDRHGRRLPRDDGERGGAKYHHDDVKGTSLRELEAMPVVWNKAISHLLLVFASGTKQSRF